jgi:NitT/TauT family transport system substrate-binding protein
MRKRIMVSSALAAAALMAVSACGSDSSSPADAAMITIAMPAISTLQTELYVAQQNGYFDRHGVDVTLLNAGALGPTKVAAGQADLAQYGTSAGFPAAVSGRPMSVVYGFATNVSRGIIVSGDSPIKDGTPAEDALMSLSGKKLVTTGTAGSGPGSAKMVGDWIVAQGGNRPTIVSVDTGDAAASQLISGQADASIGLPDYAAGAILAGKLRMPVSNSDPKMAEVTGGEFPAITLFGQSAVLKKKAKAVTGVIAALREAHAYVQTHSLSDVAEILAQAPDFEGQSIDAIKATIKYDPTFFSPEDGFVSESAWTTALKAMDNWGTGQDLSKSTFSYGSYVDMSYWNDATQLVKK